MAAVPSNIGISYFFTCNNGIGYEEELAIKESPEQEKAISFPRKLWQLVKGEQQRADDVSLGPVQWTYDGRGILIDYERMKLYLLSKDENVFKTANLSSFLRQLNLYGFKKISQNFSEWCGNRSYGHQFMHANFVRDRPDLLPYVVRSHKNATNVQEKKMCKENDVLNVKKAKNIQQASQGFGPTSDHDYIKGIKQEITTPPTRPQMTSCFIPIRVRVGSTMTRPRSGSTPIRSQVASRFTPTLPKVVPIANSDYLPIPKAIVVRTPHSPYNFYNPQSEHLVYPTALVIKMEPEMASPKMIRNGSVEEVCTPDSEPFHYGRSPKQSNGFSPSHDEIREALATLDRIMGYGTRESTPMESSPEE